MKRIYTYLGDEGLSDIPLLERVFKDNIIFEVIGTIDELVSAIGLARSLLPRGMLSDIDNDLSRVQDILFRLGRVITEGVDISDSYVKWVEDRVNYLSSYVNVDKFIKPSGHPASTALHLARTICRRLERRVVTLLREIPGLIPKEVIALINRLSDYLFLAALYVNKSLNIKEEYLT